MINKLFLADSIMSQFLKKFWNDAELRLCNS